MIQVIATIELKPGCRDEFLPRLNANVPRVKAEDGCLAYDPFVDTDSGLPVQGEVRENVVTLVEAWTSIEALDNGDEELAVKVAQGDKQVDKEYRAALATMHEQVLVIHQAVEVFAHLRVGPAGDVEDFAPGEADVRGFDLFGLGASHDEVVQQVEEAPRLRRQLVEQLRRVPGGAFEHDHLDG